MAKSEIQIPFPERGQAYLDPQARRWTIRAIRPLGAAGQPYDVLEIDLQAGGGAGTRIVMSSGEFFKLAASGYLKPLA